MANRRYQVTCVFDVFVPERDDNDELYSVEDMDKVAQFKAKESVNMIGGSPNIFALERMEGIIPKLLITDEV